MNAIAIAKDVDLLRIDGNDIEIYVTSNQLTTVAKVMRHFGNAIDSR